MNKKPDGEIIELKKDGPEESALKEGKAIVKTEVPYVTAIKVQVPRDLDRIVKAINKECEYAGQSFYYAWDIQGKAGRSRVEGGSIGLAMALAREFGNCYCPVTLEESDEAWIFTTTFIDLETGFNLQRIYRYRKDRVIPGRYDASRSEDMAFQAAQSKAIRNVILTAMPRWLVDSAIQKAKDAEIKKIDYEGIAVAADKAIKFLSSYGITEEQIKQKLGKPKVEWTSEDIATLRGLAQGLKDGQIRAEDTVAPETPKQQEAITLEEIISKPTGLVNLDEEIGKLRKRLQEIVGDDHCYDKVMTLEFKTKDLTALSDGNKKAVITFLQKEIARVSKKK